MKGVGDMKKNQMINWLTGEHFGRKTNYDEMIDRRGLFWFIANCSSELGALFAGIYALELEEYLPLIGFTLPYGFRFEKSDFTGRYVDPKEAYPNVQNNFALYLDIATVTYDSKNRPGYIYSFSDHGKVIKELREHNFSGFNQSESEKYKLPRDLHQDGTIIMQRALARYS